jgi:glycosyltransferase involved in cell wall biosynthesis
MNKILFDGSLLSQCELMGNNRAGLVRVAEELTNEIIKLPTFDSYFANFIYMVNYHASLRKFFERRYPELLHKIISKKPLPLFEVLKFKALWYKHPELLFLNVNNGNLNRYDLFHSFYYPFRKEIKRSISKKSITYYDIIPLVRSGYPPYIVNLMQRILEDIENNYAISISEYSKNDLLNYSKSVKEENVFVAPLAASKEVFFRNSDIDRWKIAKRKYDLPDRYFFCIASSDPRKNIPHVINSFDKFIREQKSKDVFLLLAGNFNRVKENIQNLDLSKDTINQIVSPLQYIEEADLNVIYSNALGFIYMSEYEGFGLPVLEAMQCGTPTISSNRSSMPEVVGNAGILLDCKDEDALAHSINLLNESSSVRDEYSKAGLQRAKEFSWERTANEYAKIFNKIINE